MIPYVGDHCESTALVNMLRNRGIELSEPLIFGLGHGLSFLYWHSKQMPGPFLGGRVKPDHLMRNAVGAIGLPLEEKETASRAKAESTLIDALDRGEVVGLKLDRFHLDYARESYHFAAHYLACIGYEDERFTVVETSALGVQQTTRKSMADARSAKGPMSSRNLSFTIGPGDYDPRCLREACQAAISATAADFLNPPITNMGYKGIGKTAALMASWCDALDAPGLTLRMVGNSLEDGGTGGGFFRLLWARFLEEARELTGVTAYDAIADKYRKMAERWTEVANLLRDADEDGMRGAVREAASIVGELAACEHKAMIELEEAAA